MSTTVLLRGVNKGNNPWCQGHDKNLEKRQPRDNSGNQNGPGKEVGVIRTRHNLFTGSNTGYWRGCWLTRPRESVWRDSETRWCKWRIVSRQRAVEES